MEKTMQNISEILQYTNGKAMHHQAYHHYTDMESLIKIIESRSFLASTGFNMNDQLELSSGMKSSWENLYFTSFSYGNESIAMWGLYCFPRESAVRISLPNKAMNSWIETLNLNSDIHYGLLGQKTKKLAPNKIKSILLTDILYTDERHRYLSRGNYDKLKLDMPIKKITQLPEMTGHIKDGAWIAENEVRLLIETTEHYGSDTKLFSHFEGSLIQALRITIGPWCEDSTYKLYVSKLVELGVLEKNITRSKFTGLLKMKSPCDKCVYKAMALKQKQPLTR